MKIKRFFAPDIRQAMQSVREQQGPDAVILANRNVEGGVEIVAAQDFDEQLLSRQLEQSPESELELELEPEPEPEPKTIQDSNRSTLVTPKIVQPKPDAEIKPIMENLLFEEDSILNELLENKPVPSADTSLATESPTRDVIKGKMESSEINKETGRIAQGKRSDFVMLHREIRQVRRLLDTHLSEKTGNQAVYQYPSQFDLLRHYTNYGFSQSLCMELANRFGKDDNFDSAKRKGMAALAARIPVAGDDLIESGGVVALVGPTGVGKTTTIAKLAARFRMKHGPNQMALISIDNDRIGAHAQLGSFGRRLGVPVRTAASPEDLRNLLNSFVVKRLVLIDTAGMGQHDDRLAQQYSFFSDIEVPIKNYLVMSAVSHLSVMKEVIEAFDGFQLNACILTKLDEAAYLGAVLSTIVESKMPLAFVTDGQRVPEDIHRANPHTLVKRCFEKDLVNIDKHYDHEGRFQYQDWLKQANV